jgi:hypothetical protein
LQLIASLIRPDANHKCTGNVPPLPGLHASPNSNVPPLPGLHASPNGFLFTTARTRRGVLPRLLTEILETRFMVKRAMKQVPVGSALHRASVLSSRRL